MLPCILVAIGCGDDSTANRDASATRDAASTARDAAGRDGGSRDATLPPRDVPLRDAGDIEITALERTLIDMPADSWMRVDTGYGSVCRAEEGDEWRAVSGCGGLLAFSGGLWDPDDRMMLLFGGGHGDYAGNEVYAFSTRTLSWERLTEPSLGPYDRDPLDDGMPVSRHTYDGMVWLSHAREMWTWGGSRAIDGNGTSEAWRFDVLGRTWTNVTSDATPMAYLMHSFVYDPVTRLVFGKSGERFIIHDPEADTWSQPHDFGTPPNWPRYAGGQLRGVLDTSRRLIFWMGGDGYMIYDIERDAFVTDDWITTGAGTWSNAEIIGGHTEQLIETGGAAIIAQADPGLDYDVNADQIVGWNGEELWVLDLASKTWIRRGTVGAPTEGTGRLYGRFRYIDALNVFIMVDSTDEVWFYKNLAGP
jgi:hypothetical protein